MASNRQKAKERQARRRKEQAGDGGAGKSAPPRRSGRDPIADDVVDEIERETVVDGRADPVTPPPLSESEQLRSGAPPTDVGSSASVMRYEQDLDSIEDDPEHFDPAQDHPEDVADIAPEARSHSGDAEAEDNEGSRLVQFLRS
ncbi:MAG: hypothetical protein ACR2HC_02690, partial [Thermoleophilaceae bacterium]